MKLLALWRWKGRRMLKIKIAVGVNVIKVDGDVPLSEVRELISQWFDVIDKDVHKIVELTARLNAGTKALSEAEKADAGNP